MLRNLIFVLAADGIVLTASVCNIVKGAGTDSQSASQSTEDAMHGN